MQEAGLFLFLPAEEGTVLRTFVPVGAIRSEQIGPLIGDALIEQKVLTGKELGEGLARQRELREQKLGELLTEHRIISHQQLHTALEKSRNMPVVRLGESLIELHMITREQLDLGLELQGKNRKKPLGEVLLELGYLTREQLSQVLTQKLGIPLVDLAKFDIDPNVLRILPDHFVHQHRVLPLCLDEGMLVVAMNDPLDPAPLEGIRFYSQAFVVPVMATVEDLSQAIKIYYGAVPGEDRVEEIAEQLRAENSFDAEAKEEPVTEADNTLVRLMNKMIVDAHAAGASDIHLETNPGKDAVLIRFRRDGVLSQYLRLPYNFRNAAVSRIKIMAGLDISEHRRAQDGRINFRQFGPANVELRVVTMPTQDGLEDVVMRLLTMGEPLPVTKLGLREPVLAALRELLDKPHGLVLVVGPTGSGKTTTLHSLISVLNVPGIKIWTAENPVEITQKGLRQVQVNPRIGWDFATVMRGFLRADPDVIMVGEMRDRETAAIAVEASLTGHLVFSTLHTNSAPETVVRLLDMGLDPFSFSDSLLGVLAQRLARRLCLKCRISHPATEAEISDLVREYCHDTDVRPADVAAEWCARSGAGVTIYEARGCEACRGTGYRGRIGLHELLAATSAIRQMMLRRASADELRAAGVHNGMRTLKQDGIEKCLAGLTDIHEVRAAAT
jgi:type II secretory ATPase GspE/PulE/Tfp pilus assembly ATPase PilB-like protein